jgi:cytochrome c556
MQIRTGPLPDVTEALVDGMSRLSTVSGKRPHNATLKEASNPMKIRTLLLGLAAAATLVLPAAAQDLPAPVQARQGQFQIMALNIGVLANMARGNAEYDAATAQTAADNLVAISSVDQSFNWPAGTDNAALDGTRALPAIWENLPDVIEKWQAFGAAAEGLAAVAGTGLEPMQAALGPVGGTCGACHDDYRASQ